MVSLGYVNAGRYGGEGLRVRPDTERGTPFFSNYFGEAGDAGFGHAVVCLPTERMSTENPWELRC